MNARELTRLIKSKCGGFHQTLDEITDTYQELCKYVGVDPRHPPVGLDLVEMALEKYKEEVAGDVFKMASRIQKRDKWFIGGYLGAVMEEWEERRERRAKIAG